VGSSSSEPAGPVAATADIARSFDIVTGYYEIGSLLELDGMWQQLEKIRILMGAEVTHRTRAAS
jgi:hypothetical protein